MPITFAYNKDLIPSAPYVQATICAQNEISVYALVDSGADVTMLPDGILREVQATHIRSQTLRGVTGHPVVVEMYLVEVKIGAYSIPGIQVVANRSGEAIIGRDVLQHLIVTLDGIGSVCEIS